MLITNGASHFIGPLIPILDRTSMEFAKSFYTHIFNHSSVGEAFFSAKTELGMTNPLVHTYALYGNPAIRIRTAMLRATMLIKLERSQLVMTAIGAESAEPLAIVHRENVVQRINDVADRYRTLFALSSMDAPGETRSFQRHAQTIGRELYSLMFEGFDDVLQSLDELVVVHDPVFFPTELAFDGKDFLCMRIKIGNRIGEPESMGWRSKQEFDFGSRRRRHQINALLIGYDGEPLNKLFFAPGTSVSCHRLFEEAPLWSRGPYDILHFAGHAYQADESTGINHFLVRGQDPPDQWRMLNTYDIDKFADLDNSFVFLNACSSGNLLGSSGQLDMAKQFIKAGARSCVLGTLPLSDYPAELFATEFYRQAFVGATVGAALLHARRYLLATTQDLMTSLSYVLFGDPSSKLPAAHDTSF
jgi:hypothetical protein